MRSKFFGLLLKKRLACGSKRRVAFSPRQQTGGAQKPLQQGRLGDSSSAQHSKCRNAGTPPLLRNHFNNISLLGGGGRNRTRSTVFSLPARSILTPEVTGPSRDTQRNRP